MRNVFNYENIMRYDLTSFVLEEFEKGYFTYIAFILDASIPILDGCEKPYKNGCIVETFTWLQPISISISKSTKGKSILFDTVNRMLDTCKNHSSYELYVVLATPYLEKDRLGNEIPVLKLVTEEICEVCSNYKFFKDEFAGLHLGENPYT